jgi:hypothetical protein
MTDDTLGTDSRTEAPGKRSERVDEAFDDLKAALAERATPEVREAIEKLRAAVLEKDAAGLSGHLADVKERHGWLYSELARHPRIAKLVNELALMGL